MASNCSRPPAGNRFSGGVCTVQTPSTIFATDAAYGSLRRGLYRTTHSPISPVARHSLTPIPDQNTVRIPLKDRVYGQ